MHLPHPSRRFSFRRVYILSATKIEASTGVKVITARQVSWSGYLGILRRRWPRRKAADQIALRAVARAGTLI